MVKEAEMAAILRALSGLHIIAVGEFLGDLLVVVKHTNLVTAGREMAKSDEDDRDWESGEETAKHPIMAEPWISKDGVKGLAMVVAPRRDLG